ncbi:MAG: hypothetical protein NWE98_07355 [Candidatus Bathyarchaeota archaeon]|nr:hypothetical protein [Candidatus Bathyarchaeota archaeon]
MMNTATKTLVMRFALSIRLKYDRKNYCLNITVPMKRFNLNSEVF